MGVSIESERVLINRHDGLVVVVCRKAIDRELAAIQIELARSDEWAHFGEEQRVSRLTWRGESNGLIGIIHRYLACQCYAKIGPMA